jgi:hypothetical protein
MKAEANYAALKERHESGVRWETIRAAWFTRIGKPDHAIRCKLIASHHRQAAKDAAAGRK